MLKSITITNMRGFSGTREFALPALAIIQGDNGKGKSSLADCIKYLGADKHDPDMIHGGAESGEIVLTLDTGDQMRARVTEKETTRFWKPKDGRRWVPGRDKIDAVMRALAYDPLEFLRLPEKKQAEALLRVMPPKSDAAEIEAAVGDAAGFLEDVALPTGGNVLDTIAAIAKALTEKRRDLGRDADRLAKHAEELQRTLPPAAPDGTKWAEEAERLGGQVAALDRAEEGKVKEIGIVFQAAKDGATKGYRSECDGIDDDINARIKALEAERDRRKQEASDHSAAAVETARQVANAAVSELRQANAPQRAQLQSDLATAKERARVEAEATGTRAAIDKACQESAAARQQWDGITAALKRLDELKATVASRCPIPGTIIEGGRIFRKEGEAMVPLSKWNQSDQDLFGVKLGLLAYGDEAGFMVLDNFEHFSPSRRTGFLKTAKRYCEERGMQFIIATVADGPLEIRDGAAQAAG